MARGILLMNLSLLNMCKHFLTGQFLFLVFIGWKDHPCSFTRLIHPVQDGKGMITISAINDNCPKSRDVWGLCQHKVICSILLKTPIKCSETVPFKRSTADCASRMIQKAVSLGSHVSTHCQHEKKISLSENCDY